MEEKKPESAPKLKKSRGRGLLLCIILACGILLARAVWPTETEELRETLFGEVNLSAAAECFGRGLRGEGLEAFRQGAYYAFVPGWGEAEEAWAVTGHD